MAETKKPYSISSTIASVLTNSAGQILVLIVVALVTVCMRSNNQIDSIEQNKASIIQITDNVNKLNNKVVVLETRMASRDADVVKLQNTVDRLNEKVASIPDRNEINESLNNLYNRLAKISSN